jgi:TRAP-type C4-dicarboxylate transport system substrate-binding protein
MRSGHLSRKLLAMALGAFLMPVTASAQKTLRYSDHEPLGNMRTTFIKDVFFAAIERESNGRLKIEDHWNSKLATGYDALALVSGGSAADLAVVVPEYKADAMPLHQIFKGFPVGPSGDKQVAFFRRVYAEVPAFPAELANNNVVNILSATGYPVAFFSIKPLTTLEDIKGSKWRTASFWHRDFLRNAGAEVVSMPWGPGIFQAMQARTLEGLMVNIDSGYDLKVHLAAPHALASKELWLGHLYPVAINRKTWDGLPKEDRDAIQRAAECAYKGLGAVMDKSFDAMVSEIRKEGVQIRALDGSEVTSFAAATRFHDVQTAWVKEQEAKGNKDAGATLEAIRALISDAMR